MRELRLSFGKEMAQDFYHSTPLPMATGHISPQIAPLIENGKECLNHLLNARFGPRGRYTVQEMIVQSHKIHSVAHFLAEGGIRVNPPEYEGYVAISYDNPRLLRAFALTKWAPDWGTPLLAVQGALMDYIRFHKKQRRRAVLIPIYYVEGA